MVLPLFRRFSTALSPSPRVATEQFIDPVFGNCSYNSWMNLWSSQCQLPNSSSVFVCGRSKRPTDENTSLWRELQSDISQLLRVAAESIPVPPIHDYTPPSFNLLDAALSEVRFEADGTVIFFLDVELTEPDGYQLYPMVTFRNWQITEAVWTV